MITERVQVLGFGGDVTVEIRVYHPDDAPSWLIANALESALALARQRIWNKEDG